MPRGALRGRQRGVLSPAEPIAVNPQCRKRYRVREVGKPDITTSRAMPKFANRHGGSLS